MKPRSKPGEAASARGRPEGGGSRQLQQHLLERVRSGDVRLARKLTHTRTLIVLDYAGREIAFIYSSRGKQIISFLPPPLPSAAPVALDDPGVKP